MSRKPNRTAKYLASIEAWLRGAPASTASVELQETSMAGAEQLHREEWSDVQRVGLEEVAAALFERSRDWAEISGRDMNFIARMRDGEGNPVSAHRWKMFAEQDAEPIGLDGSPESIIRQLQGHTHVLMRQNHEMMRLTMQGLVDANGFQAARIRELEALLAKTRGVTELALVANSEDRASERDLERMALFFDQVPKLLRAADAGDAASMVESANALRKEMQPGAPGAERDGSEAK